MPGHLSNVSVTVIDHHEAPVPEIFQVVGSHNGEWSRLTAAIPMDNPYCSCKLTRDAGLESGGSLVRLVADFGDNQTASETARLEALYWAFARHYRADIQCFFDPVLVRHDPSELEHRVPDRPALDETNR